jgi:tRNA 2-thiocytidine biosynthesis protein TtcA
MIHGWDRQYPGRIDNMLAAMGRVVPSHLMDRNLYPYTTLKAMGRADAGGDIAFDDEPCAPAPGTLPLHPAHDMED